MCKMILASSALVQSAEFEIDGDQSELDLFSKYYQETGDDLLELEGVKQTRFGMSTGNLSQRRQALIRMMFNVLAGNQKKDKSFMRKFFQYGCHCYPGGPDHLLKSGYGKPIDKIDSICQRHKNCYKCMNAIFNAGKWGIGSQTNCNPENTTYKMVLNTTNQTVSCPSDQTLCRKSLCECDLEFARSINTLPDFENEYDPNNLAREGFNYKDKCIKQYNGHQDKLKCCGSKTSFPFVEPLSGQKNSCCGYKSFNNNRNECCEDNLNSEEQIVPIGTCLSQPSGYSP